MTSLRNINRALESSLFVTACMFAYGTLALVRDIEHSSLPEFEMVDLLYTGTNVMYLFSLWKVMETINHISVEYSRKLMMEDFNKQIERDIRYEDGDSQEEVSGESGDETDTVSDGETDNESLGDETMDEE